jgi:hypothetical protein
VTLTLPCMVFVIDRLPVQWTRLEMQSRWKWNGENSAWIDCLARGEEEEKERGESYQTWRLYHTVMSQAFKRSEYVTWGEYETLKPSKVSPKGLRLVPRFEREAT